MTVAVVSTCYQEADLLDSWIRHLLAEGIDKISIADKLGNDNCREILKYWHKEDSRVEWINDDEPCHRQAFWTNRLAADAHRNGAIWIVPLDIDEFVYSTDGRTVAETLADCPHDKLYMQVWPHKDWDHKFDPHRLPKVCYKYQPEAQVVMGSHDVSLPGGEWGILEIRELQYRSFDHYCRKASDRNATLDPAARARNDGSHHLRLEGFSSEQMQQAWDEMQSRSVVFDPIPTHALI